MAKSYFAILGISPNATVDEIRSAYRRLAKEFHPDHYSGSSERFKDIQEAYSVLGNRRRRREYKQSIRKVPRRTPLRPTRYPEPEPLIPEEDPVDSLIGCGVIFPISLNRNPLLFKTSRLR
jgi:curved DNA-binding protein CbpA